MSAMVLFCCQYTVRHVSVEWSTPREMLAPLDRLRSTDTSVFRPQKAAKRRIIFVWSRNQSDPLTEELLHVASACFCSTILSWISRKVDSTIGKGYTWIRDLAGFLRGISCVSGNKIVHRYVRTTLPAATRSTHLQDLMACDSVATIAQHEAVGTNLIFIL